MLRTSSSCLLATVTLFTGTAVSSQAASILPPGIVSSFSPNTITVGDNTSLIFTVTNPNDALTLTNVNFSNFVPSGLALINETSGTCGTVTTGGGSTNINIGAGSFSASANSLTPLQSCSVTLEIQGVDPGLVFDISSNVSSDQAVGGDATTGVQVNSATPSVPEPASFALLAIGLAGLAAAKRCRGLMN